MSILNDRRCEILNKEGSWESYNMANIKIGDIFRLFDDSENPIEIGEPYIATEDVKLVPAKEPGDFTYSVLGDLYIYRE
jgi:hypothetical protein